ncbi:glycosyltransferase family 25 protein [Hoeflea prorocentri]|uniref:Glycosyltransferase family 25 protein n=1 Tax=Hoeflea prorocentri TaxID=1922333 RepID=A0A9X3ULX7_9HYPH|nr:glycosyltransferase family 25 protein [Hoeflea prorocentri]MCY6381471.1 glycosyltransferase family 25 protein [Hoeflea prorocentri]MDA5399271.1 glycosyltransferase family 25 protein [Hoeflea prorocentri]
MRKKAFIIHLTRAEARRPFVDRLIDACPMDAAVVEGVDGAALKPEDIEAVYSPGLRQPHYPFALREAEIGCFLSHRACWRRIVEDGLDYGLVLEDDATIDASNIGPAVAFAERHIAELGYIQLPVRKTPANALVRYESEGMKLLAPQVVPLRLSGQLISVEAAKRLLYVTEVFDRPVDTLLQMHWFTGIRPVILDLPVLQDNSQAAGGSTIGSGKSPWERLDREVRRFIYRRKIARLSRRKPASS